MRRLARTAFLVAHARLQARVPFRSPEALRRLQRRRIQSILRHASRSVPHYREALGRLGASPQDFDRPEDLARLPLVGRRELQESPDSFRSTRWSRDECVVLRSGGTTGAPREVWHHPWGVLMNAAHGERERSIVARHVGRLAGYREAVLAPPYSAAPALQEFVRRRTRLPTAGRVTREYFSLLEDPRRNADRMAEFRPHVVHGYGSYLGVLFRFLESHGLRLPGLAAVTYSSDPLAPADRVLIEEGFGVPVLGTYQAVEALKIGFECGQGAGIHVNVDLYPVRLVDEGGRPVGAGREGSLVVSNLVNRGTVLLNYRLGDRVTLLEEPCDCGRTLPRVTAPQERDDDWIATPDGRRVHPLAVRTLFTEEDEVRQYQVVQDGPREFRVALVTSPGAEREALSDRMRRKFAERLGADVQIQVRYVEDVERTPGGKVRPFVRRWG